MNLITDYRVNQLSDGRLISVEVTCCGTRIGEIRFKDGAGVTCSKCNTIHTLKIQHNHFHLKQQRQQGANQ